MGSKNSIEGSNPSLSDDEEYLELKKKYDAPVAQLDRVSGYEPGGREFESLRAHQFINPLHSKILRGFPILGGAHLRAQYSNSKPIVFKVPKPISTSLYQFHLSMEPFRYSITLLKSPPPHAIDIMFCQAFLIF
jgi:hypothetical protein